MNIKSHISSLLNFNKFLIFLKNNSLYRVKLSQSNNVYFYTNIIDIPAFFSTAKPISSKITGTVSNATSSRSVKSKSSNNRYSPKWHLLRATPPWTRSPPQSRGSSAQIGTKIGHNQAWFGPVSASLRFAWETDWKSQKDRDVQSRQLSLATRVSSSLTLTRSCHLELKQTSSGMMEWRRW